MLNNLTCEPEEEKLRTYNSNITFLRILSKYKVVHARMNNS